MQVVTAGGTQIILDCGTGARELGVSLSSSRRAPPIQARYLNHTSLCLGCRVSTDGAVVVYAADHAPYTRLPLDPGGTILHAGDRGWIDFAQDAGIVIHGAQHDDEEYPARIGWGHSTVRYAVGIATAARVRRLALFHHDPEHDDDAIARLGPADPDPVPADRARARHFRRLRGAGARAGRGAPARNDDLASLVIPDGLGQQTRSSSSAAAPAG